MEPEHKLRLVKILHTLVWAIFAGCIVAIPAFAFLDRVDVAMWLIAIVVGEVAVLAFNGMRCPLTDVAGHYTAERRDNFDIYLPLWLARHNKMIFGMLYLAGIVYTVVVWLTRGASV